MVLELVSLVLLVGVDEVFAKVRLNDVTPLRLLLVHLKTSAFLLLMVVMLLLLLMVSSMVCWRRVVLLVIHSSASFLGVL